jgi:acyl-CoA synthetase (AMP-forming)/AMP-acid ligase II
VAANDVLAGGAVDGAPEVSPSKASDGAYILNTSGTVAMKGVLHSHEEAQYSARTVAEIVALGSDDVVMCAVPMSWGAGLCWGVRFALLAGATLVSMERWDPREAANLIDAEGGRFIYGPPTMARDLVDLADEWRPAGPLTMICAGAPIPRQMCVDARERLGLSLIPGYGQTEHLHSVLGRLDDPIEKLTGSDGRALPGVLLRAVDDAGNECAPGEPGELECRGPNVALGYFNQPDLTNETFRPDGWQVTQDLGTFDDDGYLRIAGRKRDIIIRGGLNVSPREVEELLLRLPDVKDAAVVGVPDARYGERIYAFIVPTGKAPPSVEEIAVAFEAMGVAKYKHPERIESIAELPLTTTGKVRHQALRDQLGEAAT